VQFLVLCVEQTSSAHQTSNICCLHNTFSCVATLSELNSSQKFGILQIVLSGGSIWQRSPVSVIETLFSDKEHQVPFAGCHTTGDHFSIGTFPPAHSLSPLLRLSGSWVPRYLEGPGRSSDLGRNMRVDHHLKSITVPQRV